MSHVQPMASMLGVVAVLIVSNGALAGDFTPPPGPVGATMKSLETIEPRIPVGPDTTPGDATAVFVIGVPGSYYLTGDVIGQAGKRGIRIDVSDVGLDLGGFTLRGVPTSLSGIETDPFAVDIRIVNGTVSSWGNHGVDGFHAFESCFTNLVVADNALVGLYVGNGSSVRDCQARKNGSYGIAVNGGAALEACAAVENGEDGIVSGGNMMAINCQAVMNTGNGFYAPRGTLLNCVSVGNTGAGFAIEGSEIASVANCSAQNNQTGFRATHLTTFDHCTSAFNTGDGFDLTGGAVANTCTAYTNGDDGFQLGGGAIASGCHSSGNSYGFYVSSIDSNVRLDTCSASSNDFTGFLVAGADCLVVRNLARGNTTDYSLSGSGQYGVVITSSGTIAADPWANFAGAPPKALATDDPNLARKEAEAAAWYEELARQRTNQPHNPTGVLRPQTEAR